MHAFTSRRKQSQRKRSRPFGKLSINTQCTSPAKTFPYESRVQELSFVSFEESKARKKAHAPVQDETAAGAKSVAFGHGALKRGTVHGHVRTGTLEFVESDSGPQHAQDMLKLPSNTRINGLCSSCLDISPSDRAITIGCAFSPSTVSNYTRSPNSATSAARSPPTIVVTPAKNNFSPSDLPHNYRAHSGYRPASSVYSRYTNCASRIVDQRAPPVPPLPLFINTSSDYQHLRLSTGTTFEEDLTPERSDSAARSTRLAQPLTAGLPTPRRSKGWWNVITSPFSARSGHGSFWRSPSPTDDRIPVLDDAEMMAGSNPHAGVIFTVRSSDDRALRTAPVSGPHSMPYDDFRPLPSRSETAPGALDANSSSVNIYRIPSQGEAAAYYDPSQNFTGLRPEPNSFSESPEDDLRGWSPSNSVFKTELYRESLAEHQHDNDSDGIVAGIVQDSALTETTAKVTRAEDPAREKSGPHAIQFSTPSEDELKGAEIPKPQSNRSFTQTTGFSMMSPMSATPVLQDAHLARFVGPQSSFGEQKTVDVERTPLPTGPPVVGAIMAHNEDYRGEWSILLSEKTIAQVKHTRENSYGLGISDGERELYPESAYISEKHHSYTEQRVAPRVEKQKSSRPWYRRFFWFLVAVASAILLLLVVLLAVLIPRKHNVETAVEASWYNTTGLPALSIGVMTVIQPNMTQMRSSCVAPPDLWTCGVPGLEETSLPNFRLEIMFRDGLVPKNETARKAAETRRLARKSLFSSSALSPSEGDRLFMGRTTDNSSAPYNGEETPFDISLLNAAALQTASSLQKRDGNYTYPYPSPETKSSNASTNAAVDIPSPNTMGNGQPADEVLYPQVTAQPLRLFNRGADTEHYGFYTYFDRSMYLSGSPVSSTANSTDITSNVPLANASAVCTFSQTRLLVQIWTRRGAVNPLSTSSSSTPGAGDSTANDMSAPGSFPYPVTFKLDRHGGVSDKKGVYCYGIDNSKVISNGKLWIEEDRAAGGSVSINPAQIPGSNSTTVHKGDESSDTGIDGGNGGCSCQWQSWS